MRPAARLQAVPQYPFAQWTTHCRAAQERGIDLIRLDAGNPDLPPPTSVIERLCEAARDPSLHGYPGYDGSEPLREAIASYYAKRFGVRLDCRRQVVPLLGSKEGIVNLPRTCVDPGDVVLVPDPGYTPYSAGTTMAGGEIVRFALRAEHDYMPDLETIPTAVAQRAKLIWLNYPNNPTGAVASLNVLDRCVSFARQHDIILCHDAPYADIAHSHVRPPSILEVSGALDVAVEFNSLSKTFNMAGWRIGAAVGRSDVLGRLSRVKSNVDSGIFAPIQRAAVEALSTGTEWICSRNAVYYERLRLLAEAFAAIGLEAPLPRAGIYLWIRLAENASSEAFALRLLDATGISVAPGTFFGPRGEGYIRVSATAPKARIREAANRLVGAGGTIQEALALV